MSGTKVPKQVTASTATETIDRPRLPAFAHISTYKENAIAEATDSTVSAARVGSQMVTRK